MAQSFFDTLGARERQLARDRTEALTAMLVTWARRYSIVRTARIPSIALLTALVAPGISLIDILVTAKLAFWIFGIDDIADERTVSLAELEEKARQWCSIAEAGPGDRMDQVDELAAMLLEIREELSTLPLFEALQGYWVSEVQSFAEAMIWEYRRGVEYTTYGPDSLPTLDDYLDQGLHSISIPLWAWVFWAVMDDPSVCSCLAPLVQAAEHAGAAVRLYNDLRSFEKELGEGNINSVLIAYHAMLDKRPGEPAEDILQEAKQHILQLADSYSQRCIDLVQPAHTDSGQAEEMLSRAVSFHAYFYGRSRHDYNVTSMSDVYRLLA